MSLVNLTEKFSLFTEHWRPKVVAELNGQEVKVVKVRGTFSGHHHEREDERHKEHGTDGPLKCRRPAPTMGDRPPTLH